MGFRVEIALRSRREMRFSITTTAEPKYIFI